MRLFGRYNSPYVRRVAVTMQFYGLDYVHKSVIPFMESKQEIAKINPITRVPILELEDGEHLVDSTAIIDHLDELVGSERTLTPVIGLQRRKVLKFLALELGTMDKLIAVLYERQFRPREKWHRPWIEACETQIHDGFKWIDSEISEEWVCENQMTQADFTLAVFWEFAIRLRPHFFAKFDFSNIKRLTNKLAELDAFQNTLPVEPGLSLKMPDLQ